MIIHDIVCECVDFDSEIARLRRQGCRLETARDSVLTLHYPEFGKEDVRGRRLARFGTLLCKGMSSEHL